jgi:hypothetical protein
LGGFGDGNIAAFELLEDLTPVADGLLVAEELVDEIEPLADGGIGDAELPFYVADFPLAAQEDHHEILEIGGEAEEAGDGEDGVDLGIAMVADETGDGERPGTKGAVGDEFFLGFSQGDGSFCIKLLNVSIKKMN